MTADEGRMIDRTPTEKAEAMRADPRSYFQRVFAERADEARQIVAARHDAVRERRCAESLLGRLRAWWSR